MDDTVDDEVLRRARGERPSDGPQRTLAAWRELLRALRDGRTAVESRKEGTLEQSAAQVDAAVWPALLETLERYPTAAAPLLGLVDGVERDLLKNRYGTFEELKEYCYGVAGTVGLACLPVFGLDEESHREFAVTLGRAVQLTNILRDIPADAAVDHVYLPAEDLNRFGYGEEELKKSVYNDNFVRLMRFEASRAEEAYAAALQKLPDTSRRAARPALIMARLYRALLGEIKKRGYNVFLGRARLSTYQKMRVLPGIFWNA